MYATSKDQIAAAEKFINSLPDSIVKGNYERWLAEVKLKNGITTELLEKFVALSGGLTKEFQNFPQEFSMYVKNSVNPDGTKVVPSDISKDSPKHEAKTVAKSEVKPLAKPVAKVTPPAKSKGKGK